MEDLDVESINEPVFRLNKDLKEAAKTLSAKQARYLVDLYYQIQKYRIRAKNQADRAGNEPHVLADWIMSNMHNVEKNIKKALDVYTDQWPEGLWLKSLVGIGPVLAAGFLAHVDITVATNPSKLQRFAGLDPTVKWLSGQKRPWNARLKELCWKAADSFKKQSGKDNCYYGALYRKFKEREVSRNDQGLYVDQAAQILKDKRFDKTTDAYKAYSVGKLPPAHLDMRAMRLTSKIFLSHYHHVATECRTGKPPAKPWIFVLGGHSETDYLMPPDWPNKKAS